MKLFNSKNILQESSYTDLVNTISSSALAHPYMRDKLKTSSSDTELSSVDIIDITTADKYVNASNVPCIIILGTREDEHASFKLNEIEDIDIDNFYAKAKEIMADSLTYSNPDTYEALLYNKSSSNKPYLVRRLSVINKSEKTFELANMLQFNVSVKSVSEESTYVDNERYIISEKNSNTTYNIPTVIKNFQDELKAIEIKPFEETSDMVKPIEDSLEEGDTVHYLKIETKNGIKYPVWINYSVTEIDVDNKTVNLTPIADADDYNPDEIDSFSRTVTPDELKKNYYFGKFSVDVDYKNTCIVSYIIDRVTGELKTSEKGDCYTTIENFSKFMNDSLNPVAMNESLEKRYRNVVTKAYSRDKSLYKTVVHNFNNITNIKRDISHLISDPKVYYIDSYDENGICHYQAEKIVDYDINAYDWNVMTDDFYETTYDSKKSLSLTEAALEIDYQVIIHLPYFDINNADDINSSPEIKKIITASSKDQCIKFAENLIRKNSKDDKTWIDAYVDSVEPIEK